MPGHETREAIRRARAKMEASEPSKPVPSPYAEALQAKYRALANDIMAKYRVAT